MSRTAVWFKSRLILPTKTGRARYLGDTAGTPAPPLLASGLCHLRVQTLGCTVPPSGPINDRRRSLPAVNKQRFQGLGLAFPLGAVAAATAASLGCAPSAAAITPTVTEYTNGVTPGFSGADPEKIVRGPDGNLWFTNEEDPSRIIRITPAGGVTVVATGGATAYFAANANPAGITAGSYAHFWLTVSSSPGLLARITPSGAATRLATG